MLKMVKQAIKRVVSGFGYSVARMEQASGVEFPPDFDRADIEIIRRVAPFTMTTNERVLALCESVRYVVKHSVPGDIVECGVWKGGSMMAAAHVLMALGEERRLWLFDTFEGMPPPTTVDVNYVGQPAVELMERSDKNTAWILGTLEEVRHNLSLTGYPDHHVSYIKGKVEDTIPENAPEHIALLRLDTDWYESTYHELQHLFPRLSVGGVLIVDDYGHWAGARKAVDQYMEQNKLRLLLQRIDYTGRIAVKIES